MAETRKAKPNEIESPSIGTDIRRLTNVAALLLVKGESQPEKIRALAAAGYSNTEIATLLGITANAVAITLHRLRAK